MKNHFELTDADFLQQFENGTLPPELFSHEAHLRLAWIHLQQSGLEKALVNIPRQIQNYVAKLGVTDKYHHTLTIAAIRTVYHFVLKSTSNNFSDFILEFPRLQNSFKELLNQHYSQDIFTIPQAKEIYVEPDLAPYDA